MLKAQGKLTIVFNKMEYKFQEIGTRTRSPDKKKKAHKTSRVKKKTVSKAFFSVMSLSVMHKAKVIKHIATGPKGGTPKVIRS